MSTRELIQTEIDRLSESDLQQVFALIQRMKSPTKTAEKTGLLEKLSRIKIQAPPDFAANLDLYASGEKRVADVH